MQAHEYVAGMRYYVQLGPSPGATTVVVDLVSLPNGKLDCTVDGRPIDLDVVPVGTQLSVRVDGQVIDLTTDGVPPNIGAVASGHRSHIRVESERMRSAEQAKKSHVPSGDRVVKSPMPGRVVRVLVARGEAVRAGQGLIVLEAMKMENEVCARTAGTIAEVHVVPGATVDGMATLVTLG
jgi:biotin carboxyl carrier protein